MTIDKSKRSFRRQVGQPGRRCRSKQDGAVARGSAAEDSGLASPSGRVPCRPPQEREEHEAVMKTHRWRRMRRFVIMRWPYSWRSVNKVLMKFSLRLGWRVARGRRGRQMVPGVLRTADERAWDNGEDLGEAARLSDGLTRVANSYSHLQRRGRHLGHDRCWVDFGTRTRMSARASNSVPGADVSLTYN